MCRCHCWAGNKCLPAAGCAGPVISMRVSQALLGCSTHLTARQARLTMKATKRCTTRSSTRPSCKNQWQDTRSYSSRTIPVLRSIREHTRETGTLEAKRDHCVGICYCFRSLRYIAGQCSRILTSAVHILTVDMFFL